MKYDFHDIQTLSKVRESLSDLLTKLEDAKSRLKATPVAAMDSIFKQFIEEAIAYKKTSQYELLKAYEMNCAHERYFSNFDLDFFNKLREPNRTIGDFMNIMKAISRTSSQLYWEVDYISENYL
ncbi:MAG: hypothetical protein J6B87_06415 [Clostridia bacterium]|nr:hypothetical protein [Clostridia bacterium]